MVYLTVEVKSWYRISICNSVVWSEIRDKSYEQCIKDGVKLHEGISECNLPS